MRTSVDEGAEARRSPQPTGGLDRWFPLLLVLVSAVGAAAWVTYALTVDVPRMDFSDARNFHLLADGLADGDGYVRAMDRVESGVAMATAEYPPLFPALLAIGSLLGLDTFRDHQVVATLLAASVIPLTGLLGRRLAGPAVGVGAAVLAAAHPMLFQTGPGLMSEAVYAPLVVAVLLLAVHAMERGSIRAWAAAGFVSGLAALARGEGLLLGGIVAVAALVTTWRSDKRVAVHRAVAVALALAVVIVPWSVERTVATDGPVLVSANQQTVLAGSNCPATYQGGFRGWWAFNCFADAVRPGDSEADRYGELTSTAVDFAMERPAQLPGVAAVRALRVWGLYDIDQQLSWEATEGRVESVQRAGWAFTLATIPFAIYGALALRRRGAQWGLLVAMPAMATFTAGATYGNQRFRIAAEPVLVVLAVVGAAALLARIRARERAGPQPGVDPAIELAGGEPVPGHAEPRNRRLEGLRALAALAVMGTHLGFASGETFRSGLGAYLARLDMGVAIFFVLSGYLLYRPFVRSRLRDARPPLVRAYLWRRVLRIVPGYWFALAAIPVVLGVSKISSFTDLIVFGGFLQIYDETRALSGITQAWSLCTEMSFYLALPVYAFALRRLGRRSADPIRVEAVGLVLAYVLSVAFRTWLHASDPAVAPIAWAWLPANTDLFALGMAVAVVDVGSDHDVRLARLRDVVRRHGRWCWLGAASAFWVVSTRLGLPRGFEPATGAEELSRQFVYGIIGLLAVAPLALGAVRDRVGAVLGWSPIVWLGVLSYGIYVWHLDIIGATIGWLGATMSNASLLDLVAVVFPLSVLAAAVSWYGVERPLLRFRDLGRPHVPAEPSEPPVPVAAHVEDEVTAPSGGVPW